jgi:hypothetical protein
MSAPTTLRPVHLIPSPAAHPLPALLRAAARRALPPVDGTVAACPAPSGPCAVAVAIGGLSMVAADVAPEWVSEHVPVGAGGAVADRTDVTCWSDPDGGGVIMIGRGPGGRLDLRVELAGSERQWLTPATVVRGRDLLEAARTLADGDLFASVPAYDATALRTYLCGGFRAVGAEARFRTGPTPTWFS